MARPQTRQEITLCLKRTFNAPREKVFRAWTEPQALKRWFAPSERMSTPVAEVDLRVGGRYRIEMVNPEGKRHGVSGVYREIVPFARLVFTWAWEKDERDSGETLVTVEFFDRAGQTEVVLTHERFANAKARDAHTEGWSGCLVSLERLLS